MTNLSNLERNTLDGLSDEAGTLYLRGCGRCESAAFRMACLWDDRVAPFLDVALPVAGRPYGRDVAGDVREFVRERHFRQFFPDGRKT